MSDIIKRINTARDMPIKFLAETLANMAKHKIRKHCLKFYLVKLTDKQFFKVVTHQNIYDLLGSDKQELGKEISWHLDFKSGFRWNPKEYYLGTGKHVTLDDDSDVKVPRELSRCQHFVTLRKAYWCTSDEIL